MLGVVVLMVGRSLSCYENTLATQFENIYSFPIN